MKNITLGLILSCCFFSYVYAQNINYGEVTVVDLSDSTTEYSTALGSTNKPIKKFGIKCRTSSAIKIGFNSGDTSDTYITVPSGSFYEFDDLKYSGTLYIKGSEDSLEAEVIEWD